MRWTPYQENTSYCYLSCWLHPMIEFHLTDTAISTCTGGSTIDERPANRANELAQLSHKRRKSAQIGYLTISRMPQGWFLVFQRPD